MSINANSMPISGLFSNGVHFTAGSWRKQPVLFPHVYQSVNFWCPLTRTVRKQTIKMDLYRTVGLNRLIIVAVAGSC